MVESIFPSRYITDSGLQNLKAYKYSSGLSGYLDRIILTPYWEWAVTFMPLWIAPNLITTISLAFAIMAYLLVTTNTPTFTETPPPLNCFLAALFFFIYQTLDAIDGKQARRTGTSSPLGQLFDHGCDSIVALTSGIMLAGALGTGNSIWTFLLEAITCVPFYISNWEEAHTSYMRFGVLGVTEGQYLMILVLILSGIGTPALFHIKIYKDVMVLNLFIGIACVGVIYQCITSIYTVYIYISKLSDSVTPNKSWRKGQAYGQLAEFIVYCICVMLYTYSPNSTTFDRYTHLHLITLSSLFSYQVTRLIISHVAYDNYPFLHPVLYPLYVLTVLGYITPLRGIYHWIEIFVLIIYLLYSVASFGHFWYVSIRQITDYLGIRCFHIPKRIITRK